MNVRPPMLGWALLTAGYLLGCTAMALTWTLAQVGPRREVRELRVLAVSVATKCAVIDSTMKAELNRVASTP